MFNRLKKIYQNIKKINKSVETYKKDTVIQSLPTVAYVNKAKKLIDKGQYDQAKEVLISALDISGQDALVYKYLGKIYEHNKDFKHGVEHYEKSIALNPNDREIWLRLGMCLLYSDSLDNAILAFEQADKNMPNNTDVYTGWGMTLMKQKKYALALDKFHIAAQINKYNFTAILLSSVMEIRLGEYKQAEEKLNFLIKVAPNESSLYEYSHLKLIQSDYDKALEYANKTKKYNKQMLPAYFICAEVYSIKRDIENLQNTFNQALDVGLDCNTLHMEWGKCLVRMLEFDKAKEQFTAIEEKEPNAKIGLALLNSYKGNFELLNELKEQNLNNVYIQEAMGFEYLSENKFEQAVDMFKKSLKTDIHQTYNYYGLVLSYQGLKNDYKVREYFEKFIECNPHYIQGLLNYSQWLINVSDFEEAQRKLKRAQKLDENNIWLLNMLFLTQYTLVKKNICEYNVKEAITTAIKAIEAGKFDYYPEKQELDAMLGRNE